MHIWVREAEHILAGAWAEPGTPVTSAEVAHRFDTWRRTLAQCQETSELSEEQRSHLAHFLRACLAMRSGGKKRYTVKHEHTLSK